MTADRTREQREQREGGSHDSSEPANREGEGQSSAPPQGDREFRERDRGGERSDHEDRDRPRDRERDRSEQPHGGGQGNNNGQDLQREPEFGEGIIEISGKGFGFLRDPKRNFVQTPQDIFVTPEIVRRFNLRDGMWVQGETRRGNRGPQLMRLNKINDDEPTKYQELRPFEELTTINPNKRIKLETVPDRFTTRIMDLMTPLGMGQRGIIVAPPRTGKTTLLHHIADAVTKNHPEMKLIILLVDERPEEVTDFRRSCPGAEIMASSNDSDIKSHTRIAQLAIERAKRMVEAGKHVFILLDSITRTARAFNNATGGGGRTMSGGIDARAMEIPRKIFAAARNTEEAGSLTIVATALDRNRQPHGRAHFPRVQRHREHGAGARSQDQRSAHLPGSRYFPLRHPSRRAAPGSLGAGEDQPDSPRPRRSQTGGSNPAPAHVREEIPHEYADAERDPGLTTVPRRTGAEEVEWEILPPEEKGQRARVEPLFRWIAFFMDDFLRLPGTKFRFGLDPLIGLIPGIGDTGSALVSAFALIQAVRTGIPKIVLARMSMNILLNEVIGIVPVLGDAFSFWFKSNARNHALLQQHLQAPRKAQASDWFFVFGILLALVVVVGAGLFVSLWLIQQFLRLLTAR